MVDFKEVNGAIMPILGSLVQTWIPGGKIEGVEYVCKNPNRPDKNPGSFKVNLSTGVWKDFSSGESGADAISLYAFAKNINNFEAAKELSENDLKMNHKPAPVKNNRENWKVIACINTDPPPTERWSKPDGKWESRPIEKLHPYKTLEGDLLGYTALVRKSDGSKDVIPYRWCENKEGKKAWRQRGFKGRRPLYNQESLLLNKYAQILIVEGEKCCDAAEQIFKGDGSVIPISWLGGCKNVKNADWSVIENRKVIIWPDADKPGIKAAKEIYNYLKEKNIAIKTLNVDGKEKGWDIADFIEEGATKKDIGEFIKNNLIDFEKIDPVESNVDELVEKSRPFQFLGYNSTNNMISYYYLPNNSKKVIELNPAAHTKMNLMSIAGLDWFDYEFGGQKGVKWSEAADWMMKLCKTKGLYDPTKIRGRGAWFDDGRVVLHLGNKLIVDNVSVAIDQIKSRYVYEAEIPIEADKFSANDILSIDEAKKLLDISESLSWVNAINGKLYAGWIMLATICGAIDWRPHIWITGESGTGKTWIQENITSIVLGHSVINASSNSTEAGIRQTIGNDAFPIVFDEIEAEDQDAQKRVQRILELARQASSNKSSSIIKGSAGGKAQEYIVRSPFLFSSINPKMMQQADINRVSTLKLVKRNIAENEVKFEETKELVVNTITDEWSAKLRSRAIYMIPVIRKNIEIFSNVMTRILKSKRHGDQIGTLIAGAYALKSDGVVKEEKAMEWLSKIEWDTEIDINNDSDHDKCLRILMEQLVPVNGTNDKRSIGSLIHTALNKPTTVDPIESSRLLQDFKDSRETLRKYGISTVKNRSTGVLEIAIAENHSMLSNLLKFTPWHAGYRHVLGRIKGVYYKTAVFSDSLRSRAIIIPGNEMFDKDDIYDNLTETF